MEEGAARRVSRAVRFCCGALRGRRVKRHASTRLPVSDRCCHRDDSQTVLVGDAERERDGDKVRVIDTETDMEAELHGEDAKADMALA